MTEPRKPAAPAAGRWFAAVRGFAGSRQALFGAAGWITLTYVAQQFLRLFTNIILAWLLAPALLGTMLLINTLRTAGELLTDVGVGQSIVNNRRGNEPAFYNTAWTIQIVRGLILYVIAMALTVPIARGYDNPELLVLLPAVAPVFILTGLTSPSRFLLQKQLEIRKLALFDLASAVFGALVQIALAYYMPTIWALIWGLLIGTAVPAVASFFLIDWRSHHLRWEGEAVRAILHFGKWIFFSSLIYFLAMNFDRLYFASAVSLTLLGIYGIARTFADTVVQFFQRIGNLLIFPKVSATAQRGQDLQRAIRPVRLATLLLAAVSLAFAVAIADIFVYFVYDPRYHAAGLILAILLFGSWFGILAAIADAMMMGIGKPSVVAFSNAGKLAVIVVALTWVLPRYGMNAALLAFVFADAVRYAMLAWQKRSVGLSFLRQDAALTILFVLLIIFFREATMLAGWTTGVGGWLEQARQPYE
ncbi:oligosaccharide flippase family protein [Sphingopyxis solisilvae]|uniref:oligosaccharide flippase family protein n=1 Tax=Sphingopyxis solisilvae TaxID=1886788 RepID=UPI00189289B6|nr:oligosaccharide flippase family protein [Sphingopyxis solisilvae]